METSGSEARLDGLEHIGGDMVDSHRIPRTMQGGGPADDIDLAEAGESIGFDDEIGLVPRVTIRQTEHHDHWQGARRGRGGGGCDLDSMRQFERGLTIGGGHPAGDEDQQDIARKDDPLDRNAPEVALALS